VEDLKKGKETTDNQNLVLMEQVQVLKRENAHLMVEVRRLTQQLDQVNTQLNVTQAALATAKSAPPQPPAKKSTNSGPSVTIPIPQLTPTVSLIQQVESERPDLAVTLRNPTARAVLEAIEMQSIIKQLLGTEVRELENQLKKKKSSAPPPPATTTTSAPASLSGPSSSSSMLAHIDSLQAQLIQAKSDNTELRHTLSELTLTFSTLTTASNPGDKNTALTETIRMLGEHIGNVLQEKEEVARQVDEERQALAAEKELSKDETYLRGRLRRMELELATEKQERAIARERMQALEEQNLKYRAAITALGQQVVQLEVKQSIASK